MSEAAATAVESKSKKVEPPKVPTDDEIPTLEEVIGHRGRSGIEYVYAKAKHLVALKAEGFRLSPNGETVEIRGETYLVMFRGEPVGVGGEGASLFLDVAE